MTPGCIQMPSLSHQYKCKLKQKKRYVKKHILSIAKYSGAKWVALARWPQKLSMSQNIYFVPWPKFPNLNPVQVLCGKVEGEGRTQDSCRSTAELVILKHLLCKQTRIACFYFEGKDHIIFLVQTPTAEHLVNQQVLKKIIPGCYCNPLIQPHWTTCTVWESIASTLCIGMDHLVSVWSQTALFVRTCGILTVPSLPLPNPISLSVVSAHITIELNCTSLDILRQIPKHIKKKINFIWYPQLC